MPDGEILKRECPVTENALVGVGSAGVHFVLMNLGTKLRITPLAPIPASSDKMALRNIAKLIPWELFQIAR